MSAFFPFNPRRPRLLLLAATLVCLALTGLSMWQALARSELLGVARAGVTLGLFFAFGSVWRRLLPRAGWGVRVDPLVLTISRPFSNDELSASWNHVAQVAFDGKRRDRLVVSFQTEDKDSSVLLPRYLFAEARTLESLAQALEEHLPRPPHDA